jgi:hypothetical protein
MKDLNKQLTTDNKEENDNVVKSISINNKNKPSKVQQRLAVISKKLGLCFAIYQR